MNGMRVVIGFLLEHVLHCKLDDSSAIPGRSGSAGGGSGCSDPAKLTVVQIQRGGVARDEKTQAVGYIEGFSPNLQPLSFADTELPGDGLIPLPKSRSPQTTHSHVAVGIHAGKRERGWVEVIHAR